MDEYYKWMAYISYKKPDITEQQLAVLSTIVSNALGGKAKVEDFLVSKPKKETSNKVAPMDANAIATIFSAVSTPR